MPLSRIIIIISSSRSSNWHVDDEIWLLLRWLLLLSLLINFSSSWDFPYLISKLRKKKWLVVLFLREAVATSNYFGRKKITEKTTYPGIKVGLLLAVQVVQRKTIAEYVTCVIPFKNRCFLCMQKCLLGLADIQWKDIFLPAFCFRLAKRFAT